MGIRTLGEIGIESGKTALIRVDFNVPIRDGLVSNDRRIVRALQSIKAVTEQGGKAVLMTHLGRPAGDRFEEEHSVGLVAEYLSGQIGKNVLVGPPSVIGLDLKSQFDL